jgi:hypothetical protein
VEGDQPTLGLSTCELAIGGDRRRFERSWQAIAKAEAVTGNAARWSERPRCAYTRRRERRNLAARMLLVSSERDLGATEDARLFTGAAVLRPGRVLSRSSIHLGQPQLQLSGTSSPSRPGRAPPGQSHHGRDDLLRGGLPYARKPANSAWIARE